MSPKCDFASYDIGRLLSQVLLQINQHYITMISGSRGVHRSPQIISRQGGTVIEQRSPKQAWQK